MFPDWYMLTPDQQLALSQAALRSAAEVIASQAEMLACEIEVGALSDHGGPDALRLLATLVRLAGPDVVASPIATLTPVGHA